MKRKDLAHKLISTTRQAVLDKSTVPVNVRQSGSTFFATWSLPAMLLSGEGLGWVGPISIERVPATLQQLQMEYVKNYNAKHKNSPSPVPPAPMVPIKQTPSTIDYEAEFTSSRHQGVLQLDVQFKNITLNSHGVTDTGGEFKVFSALIEAARQILTVHPEYQIITFSAALSTAHNRPQNRQQLYSKIVQRFLPNYAIHQRGTGFVVWNKALALRTPTGEHFMHNNIPGVYDPEGNVYLKPNTLVINGAASHGEMIQMNIPTEDRTVDANEMRIVGVRVPSTAVTAIKNGVVYFDAKAVPRAYPVQHDLRDTMEHLFGPSPADEDEEPEAEVFDEEAIREEVEGLWEDIDQYWDFATTTFDVQDDALGHIKMVDWLKNATRYEVHSVDDVETLRDDAAEMWNVNSYDQVLELADKARDGRWPDNFPLEETLSLIINPKETEQYSVPEKIQQYAKVVKAFIEGQRPPTSEHNNIQVTKLPLTPELVVSAFEKFGKYLYDSLDYIVDQIYDADHAIDEYNNWVETTEWSIKQRNADEVDGALDEVPKSDFSNPYLSGRTILQLKKLVDRIQSIERGDY